MQYAKGRYGLRPVTPAFGQYDPADRLKDKKDGQRRAAQAHKLKVARCDWCGFQFSLDSLGDIVNEHWHLNGDLLCYRCSVSERAEKGAGRTSTSP